MKKLKKMIAFLLAAVALMSAFILPTSAADEETDEEVVARMYIGHKPRYGNLSGHTWVYIENLTDHSLTVGAYTLKKGKGVSVGTFGYSIADGRGLYYNVEAYRYRNSDLSSYIHLSKDLTQEQLDKVSKKILRSGVWDYTINCAFAAIRIWNAAPGMHLVYMMLPPLTQLQILANPNHGEGFKMTTPKMSEVYKQVGMGSDATLVTADPKVPE